MPRLLGIVLSAVLAWAGTVSAAAAPPAPVVVSPEDYCATGEQQGWLASLVSYDIFTNGGSYVPRVECMQTAEGSPDWFWIIALIVLTLGVIAWYARIFVFWRQCYYAEEPKDRNCKMMQLANIFLWCAVCGYAMSVVMFFWPAYRLLAVFLLILNIWAWRFVMTIGDFRIALSAKRLERELNESLASRAAELESLVAQRTAEAEAARAEAEAARAEAEAANRSKSMFLANMSHEIRTPMTAILGFTDLLDCPRTDEEEYRESMETIRRNGTHLLQVINDILDLSKIESGELSAEAITCDPRVVVEDTLRLYHERASTKGIVLSSEIADDLPTEAVTDPTRLRQILFNLVSNAIKFTSEGNVVLSARAAGDDLEFSVRDTGVGMSVEQIGRVFEPFAQADESTTRRFGGTGLGLSIARALAQRLGGDIEATSVLGEGSEFTVRIKRKLATTGRSDGATVAHTRAQSASPLLALRDRQNCLSGRALLVEDGLDNQKLISHVLRRAGLHVDVAENGRTGSDRAIEAQESGHPYDLIIMDMQMPEMDGYEASTRLREHGVEVPIVALTANAMSGDRDRCIAAGCTDYATKPLNVPVLLDLLSRLLDQGGNRQKAA